METTHLKIPIMLISLSFGITSFFLPIYSKQIGMNAIEIGGMFSLVSLITLVLRPVMGKVSDRIGRKPLLIGSMVLYTEAFYLLATASTVEEMYVVRGLEGVAASLMGIATYAMIIDTVPTGQVAEGLGKYTTARTHGMMIGAGMTFLLLCSKPFLEAWALLFRLFALGALAAGGLVFFKTPETKHSMIKQQRVSLQKLSHHTLCLMGIALIVAFSTSMMAPILVIYLQDVFKDDLIGISLSYVPSMLIYSMVPGRLGRMGDKHGRVKVIIIGLMLGGGAAGLIPVANSLVFIAIIWMVDAVGDLLEGPSRNALLAQLVDKEMTGSVYGIYSAVCGIGAMFGPLLGGILYDRVSRHIPFYLCSVGLIVAALLVGIIFYKEGPKNEQMVK